MPNTEPTLLTQNNPMVDQFYDNTQSNIILITDDKLKVILLENKETIVKNHDYFAPSTLIISLILTFCTTDFKDFLSINAGTWKGLYLALTLGALIWLFITIKQRKRSITIDELIDRIRNQKNQIVILSAIYFWDSGKVDIISNFKKMVLHGTLQGVVDPTTFGISDPIFGTQKTLKVLYRINGQEKELSCVDGKIFKIE